MIWATRFTENWKSRGGESRDKETLVLAEATSEADARNKTGLVNEKFVPATPTDLEEWADLLDQPLDEHELRALTRMAASEARAKGRSRLRRRESFLDRNRAGLLNVAAAKLSRMMGAVEDVY